MFWITRPHQTASSIVQACRDNHIPFIHHPLIEYDPLDFPETSPEKTLILTSQIPLLFLPKPLKKNPLMCVGKTTATLAKEKGIKNIYCPGESNVKALIKYIKENFPKNTPFHYLRGSTISYDLKSELEKDGYSIRESIVYRSIPNDQPFLDLKFIKQIAFYSREAAKAFLKKCDNDDLSHISAYALSDNILDVLKDCQFSSTIVVNSTEDLIDHLSPLYDTR